MALQWPQTFRTLLWQTRSSILAEEPVGERDESEPTMIMQFVKTFSFAGKNNFLQWKGLAQPKMRHPLVFSNFEMFARFERSGYSTKNQKLNFWLKI